MKQEENDEGMKCDSRSVVSIDGEIENGFYFLCQEEFLLSAQREADKFNKYQKYRNA